MKKFLWKTDIEKWLHQNRAEYTGDFFEGCLLDNFIVTCKNGVAACYEHYCNEWSSCYEIHFGRISDDINAIYKEFYEREEMAREAC